MRFCHAGNRLAHRWRKRLPPFHLRPIASCAAGVPRPPRRRGRPAVLFDLRPRGDRHRRRPLPPLRWSATSRPWDSWFRDRFRFLASMRHKSYRTPAARAPFGARRLGDRLGRAAAAAPGPARPRPWRLARLTFAAPGLGDPRVRRRGGKSSRQGEGPRILDCSPAPAARRRTQRPSCKPFRTRRRTSARVWPGGDRPVPQGGPLASRGGEGQGWERLSRGDAGGAPASGGVCLLRRALAPGRFARRLLDLPVPAVGAAVQCAPAARRARVRRPARPSPNPRCSLPGAPPGPASHARCNGPQGSVEPAYKERRRNSRDRMTSIRSWTRPVSAASGQTMTRRPFPPPAGDPLHRPPRTVGWPEPSLPPTSSPCRSQPDPPLPTTRSAPGAGPPRSWLPLEWRLPAAAQPVPGHP